MLWIDASGELATTTERAWHIAYLATVFGALAGFALLRLAVHAHMTASDERLAAARDTAYRIAYWIVAPAIVIALFAVELAWNQSWGSFTLTPVHLRAQLLAFTAAALWLPAAILAWREHHL